MKVHTFDSTSEAYNASQTDDNIKDGDVLSVPSEGVHGVLVKAWPVAATAEHGAFHQLKDGVKWESYEGGRYFEAASHAALIGVPAYATEPRAVADGRGGWVESDEHGPPEPREEEEPPCPVCGSPVTNQAGFCEFKDYPGKLFHEACVEEVGTDHVRDLLAGKDPLSHFVTQRDRLSDLKRRVQDLRKRIYDPEDVTEDFEPFLARMERDLQNFPRQTLTFKFEEDGATGEPFAIVDGVMPGRWRGIYTTQPDYASDRNPADPEYPSIWVKQGIPAQERPPEWLTTALDAAWEDYWETAETVRAAEAAAGWDPTP